jgi:integrase
MAGFKNGLQRVGVVYHYCFRLHGKQYKGSTRAHDLLTARKVLEEKRQEAILGKTAPTKEAPNFETLVKDWITTHAQTASPRHIQNVELISRIWLTPYLGKCGIDRVTQGQILDVRSRMLEAGRSMATANHLLRVVKLLWNYAVAAGFIEQVPFKVKALRIQRKPRPTVPASRVPEFLAAIDSKSHSRQVAVMLKVMLGMGMRESEVLGMRWAWFDLDQHLYIVGKSKGKEARSLPVPGWLWIELRSLPMTLSGLVFPGEDGKAHHPHFCRKVLQRVCNDLGLKGVTQHRLRSSFASLHASEAGTPISEIQSMLGHKNIQTTMIYVETSLEAKRRAQDALSERLGLAGMPPGASAAAV